MYLKNKNLPLRVRAVNGGNMDIFWSCMRTQFAHVSTQLYE